MKSFRVSRRIEFVDTDMIGIVHYSNYFRFMEAAECAFLRELGLGVMLEWEGHELGLPRVSATCDYQSPARFQDVIDIDVQVTRIGTKSITYRFDFSRAGQTLGRGQLTCVCCCKRGDGEFEPIEIPPTFRARLEGYLDTTTV